MAAAECYQDLKLICKHSCHDQMCIWVTTRHRDDSQGRTSKYEHCTEMLLVILNVSVFLSKHPRSECDLTVWAPSPAAESAGRWAGPAGSDCNGADGKLEQLAQRGHTHYGPRRVSVKPLCNAPWPYLGLFLQTRTGTQAQYRKWPQNIGHDRNTHIRLNTGKQKKKQKTETLTSTWNRFYSET